MQSSSSSKPINCCSDSICLHILPKAKSLALLPYLQRGNPASVCLNNFMGSYWLSLVLCVAVSVCHQNGLQKASPSLSTDPELKTGFFPPSLLLQHDLPCASLSFLSLTVYISLSSLSQACSQPSCAAVPVLASLPPSLLFSTHLPVHFVYHVLHSCIAGQRTQFLTHGA